MTKQLDNDDLFIEAWSQFSEQITSDDDAADAIFQSMLHDNEIDCGCSRPQILRDPGARSFLCVSCKREVWFTAGSLFAGVSRLRAWMAAIWFKEWGVAVSSLKLSRLLGIAQSTALNINKKVAIAIVNQMDEGAIEVDSRRFSDAIIKRSRQTPADEHPRAELSEKPEAANHADDGMTLIGGNNCSSILLTASSRQLAISMAVAGAIAFIRKYFHGVSHKYLQVYIGAFWCHSDRRTWSQGTLLKACLKHPPISYLDLLHYNVPAVRMMLT
ncbi:hypothetical protein BH11CYA1_BH11CYA1_05480 [soil metagenome]